MIKFRLKRFSLSSLPVYTSPVDQGLGGSKLSKGESLGIQNYKMVEEEISYEKLRNVLPEEFFKIVELSKTVPGIKVQFPDVIQELISKSGGERIDNLIILDSPLSPGLGYNLKTRSWYNMASGRKLINNNPVSFIQNVISSKPELKEEQEKNKLRV